QPPALALERPAQATGIAAAAHALEQIFCNTSSNGGVKGEELFLSPARPLNRPDPPGRFPAIPAQRARRPPRPFPRARVRRRPRGSRRDPPATQRARDGDNRTCCARLSRPPR